MPGERPRDRLSPRGTDDRQHHEWQPEAEPVHGERPDTGYGLAKATEMASSARLPASAQHPGRSSSPSAKRKTQIQAP